jgi:uncharacterized membrane protein
MAMPTLLVVAAFLVVAVVFVASSDWYLAFKTVHVVCAVLWIGGAVLLNVLGFIADRAGDTAGKATVAGQAASVAHKVFTPSALLVLLAGIGMMVTDFGKAAWDWESFWLAFGLLGFVATFVIGIAVLTPAVKRVDALATAHGPEAPETQTAISRVLLIARIDAAMLLLVVVDMIAKPFL